MQPGGSLQPGDAPQPHRDRALTTSADDGLAACAAGSSQTHGNDLARLQETAAPTKRRTSTRASAGASVDGVEPLVDALDSEIRLRISTSTVVAAGIVVLLLILTAAVSANWLFALAMIVLAFAAGWLTARSSNARS